MPVIPFPQRPANGEPAPVPPGNRQARIHGTFLSPSGGLGTMTGWLRLERFHVVSERLCAAGVFTGELVDSAGTTIGVGSRRRSVPAEITRSRHDMAVVIGPVDLDLLGLAVSIPAFTMDTGVVRQPLRSLAGGLDNHQGGAAPAAAPAPAPVAPAPTPATAPPPGLAPAIAPVASAVALKRRYLGSVLEEVGQPR